MKTLKRTLALILITAMIAGVGVESILFTGIISTSNEDRTVVVVNEDVPEFPVAGFSGALTELTEMESLLTVDAVETPVVASSYEDSIPEKVVEEPPIPKITRKVKNMEKEMYVNTSVLNIRESTSTDSDVVGKLKCGDKVKVTQKIRLLEDGNTKSVWFKIDKKDGYVSADYLQNECPLIYLGEYWITYYCACAICCGKETGITASGNPVQEGVTIAAPKEFAFGTKLIFDDHTYTVQDRGGAIKGKHIDVYVATHSSALYEHANHWAAVYMYPDGSIGTK